MKKFYTNKLPKDLNGKVEGVRIENGQLIVEVEFEKEFQPKDGDFLAVKKYGLVFIYSDKPPIQSNCVCSYCGSYGDEKIYISITFSDNWYYKNGCRYATEQEKASFLERLEKEYGKRWNAEKKQLEDIRWRADKKGMYYYLVAGEMPVVHSCVDIGISCDNIRYNAGNYFRTHEAAQKVADQIKEILKNSKAE